MTHRNIKIAITTVVLVGAFGGLLWSSLREGTEYYKHVDEVMGNIGQLRGKHLQVHGYVVKDSPLEAIVTSILAVVAGARVLSEAIADRVLSMISGGPPTKAMYDGLTQREVEILRLLATGVANKQVAFRLKISDKTVRNHISHIYEKLNIFDRSQAVLYAVRKGIVEV